MKPFFKLLIVGTIGITALTGCFEADVKEAHYMGVWQITQYNVNGYDYTLDYLSAHRNYAMYVKPGHHFTESWIDANGAENNEGTWEISENGKSIFLFDSMNHERKYDLNYMYTLKLKMNNEEWIFRKI